jgi:nickel superoxide dismutase
MKRFALARAALLAISLLALVGSADKASAHCQVPCGIYDDPARIARLQEDAATISKAIGKIAELSGKHDAQSLNQAIRWVTTKDAHASHIVEVCAEYFLTQRIKPVAKGAEERDAYLERLARVHTVMVAAMKTKQKASPEAAADLDEAIAAMAAE